MNVLGIDFGEKHVGLALGSTETGLAEPLKVKLKPDQIDAVYEICELDKVDKIIVGVSEGKSAALARKFAKKFAKIGIPIEFYDETLSTRDAINNLSHLSIKKRNKMEHAAAAAVILQNWLTDNV